MKEYKTIEGRPPKNQRHRALVFVCFLIIGIMTFLSACGGGNSGGSEVKNPLADYPPASMENYRDMEGVKTDFVDITVKDIEKLMKDKATFAFLASFETCPWCNQLLFHLNEVAQERGVTLGYLDTRKNPEWNSNIDIDDYDIFVELFGDYLSPDEAGIPHLYVPMLIFIKDGQVVNTRNGVLPEIESADQVLTEEIKANLKADLGTYFDSLQ